MSFAPEVVTGDFSLGKVTGPLHSGTLCSSRVSHLVASLVLCCCPFLPSLLCALGRSCVGDIYQ